MRWGISGYTIPTHCSQRASSVGRPLPIFYLAAVERVSPRGCEIKSGRRPGNEATSSVYSLVIISLGQ